MYPSGVTCLSENSWLRIRIVCLCEATCVPTDYYYSDPGLCEATCVPTDYCYSDPGLCEATCVPTDYYYSDPAL